MVQLPASYKRSFPDQELVVLDLIQPWLDEMTPQGVAVNWLPGDATQKVAEGISYATVSRVPGGGVNGVLDEGVIQVAVLASSRTDSWAVTEYLRSRLLDCLHGVDVSHEDGSSTRVHSVTQNNTPLLPSVSVPDQRLTWATYNVTCRKYR